MKRQAIRGKVRFMEADEICNLFEKGLGLFLDEQAQLLELDVNERAIGAVLAHLYLRPLFPNYRVDAEYNRVGLDGSAKRLNLPAECGGENKRVFPDIVVHRRGDDEENILVVEIKMTTNKQARKCDLIKLEAFREQLRYKVGAFIDLPAGKEAAKKEVTLEWFR